LLANVYNAADGGFANAVTARNNSQPGNFNMAVLGAMLDGNGSQFTVNGEKYAVTQGLVESYVGANQYGRIAAAFDGVLDIGGAVFSRVGQINRQFAEARKFSGADDALASAILNRDYCNRVWFSGLGLWQDMDARDGFAGYEYDSYGFITGLDRAFGAVTVGGAFSYASGDYENKLAEQNNSDIDNFGFNLYASYNHACGLFASLLGGYALSDNNIREVVGGMAFKEDYNTNSWYLGGKLGYDWRPAANFSVTPSVGLTYVNAKAKGHNRYAGGIGPVVAYGSVRQKSTLLPIDLAVGYDITCLGEGNLNLSANVGYSYNFDGDAVDGVASLVGLNNDISYDVRGGNPGRHTLNLGGAARFQFKRFDIGVRYDYYGKSGYDAHKLTGSVGVSF
jgi:outer membrane autotransporter protein